MKRVQKYCNMLRNRDDGLAHSHFYDQKYKNRIGPQASPRRSPNSLRIHSIVTSIVTLKRTNTIIDEKLLAFELRSSRDEFSIV